MDEMDEMDELELSWKQYLFFTKNEIYNAVENVITLKNKILQLYICKGRTNLETDKMKIQKLIDRLEMSKECIKIYYKIEINL
jgi:hypothetical protein